MGTMATITTDPTTIESIIEKASICRIGMADGDRPYVVPVNFGYRDRILYFHSSPTGAKMDILQKNSLVCLEFDVDVEMVEAKRACKWDVKYRSVIGFGHASIVEDPAEKRRALDLMMAHYSDADYAYPEEILAKTSIVRVDVEQLTAKVSGY
ncbi:MAG TPA: pyridoxamine 5'-phosphate oxidase family protein [Chloroflexi bacterium]|nr:pyridoxamine 5'-phosphate oxidase family protein [Chloroflexota bacterium]